MLCQTTSLGGQIVLTADFVSLALDFKMGMETRLIPILALHIAYEFLPCLVCRYSSRLNHDHLSGYSDRRSEANNLIKFNI
jgi:hypothetical protein